MRAFCVKIFGFEFKTSDGYLDTVLAVTRPSTLDISGKKFNPNWQISVQADW